MATLPPFTVVATCMRDKNVILNYSQQSCYWWQIVEHDVEINGEQSFKIFNNNCVGVPSAIFGEIWCQSRGRWISNMKPTSPLWNQWQKLMPYHPITVDKVSELVHETWHNPSMKSTLLFKPHLRVPPIPK